MEAKFNKHCLKLFYLNCYVERKSNGKVIPLFCGKQIGRMNCLNGTRSVKRSKAMSLSITLKIDRLEILRAMFRVSSEGLEHVS